MKKFLKRHSKKIIAGIAAVGIILQQAVARYRGKGRKSK